MYRAAQNFRRIAFQVPPSMHYRQVAGWYAQRLPNVVNCSFLTILSENFAMICRSYAHSFFSKLARMQTAPSRRPTSASTLEKKDKNGSILCLKLKTNNELEQEPVIKIVN